MADEDNMLLRQLGDPEAQMYNALGGIHGHLVPEWRGPSFQEILGGVRDAVQHYAEVPRRVYRGEVDPLSDEGIQWGADTAMGGVGGTAPIAAARGPAAANQLNMFIMPRDAAAATEAARMEAAGVPRERIFQDTDIFRGADRNWREEIADPKQVRMTKDQIERNIAFARSRGTMSDADYLTMQRGLNDAAPGTFGLQGGYAYDLDRARYLDAFGRLQGNTEAAERFTANGARADTGFTTRADNFLRHPELWKANPDLAKLPVTYDPNLAGGFFENGAMTVGGNGAQLDAKNPLSGPMLFGHEMQHAVQDAHGWAPGGNPSASFEIPFRKKLAELDDLRSKMQQETPGSPAFAKYADQFADLQRQLDIANQNREKIGNSLYYHLAGEVEANNTMNRWGMTMPERRAKPPWQTQQFPYDQQILLPR